MKINDIRIDGSTQSRVRIDEATVAEYAEAMTDGAKLPPVIVFHDGAHHWLADGFHRYLANQRIGAVTIDADVRPGTQVDAKLFAYGANKDHGLRRTNADKAKAVDGMLADFSDWSDNRIAKHVGVNDKTVGAHRRAIFGNSEDAPTTRTVERAGKTYTQDVSGQQRSAHERAKEQAALIATGRPDPEPTIAAPRQQPEPPSQVKTTKLPAVAEAVPDDEEGAPSADELADAERAAVDDAERVRLILESDDAIAALSGKVTQQAAQIRILESRVRGLIGEKDEAVKLAKSWRAKFDKLERAQRAAA